MGGGVLWSLAQGEGSFAFRQAKAVGGGQRSGCLGRATHEVLVQGSAAASHPAP